MSDTIVRPLGRDVRPKVPQPRSELPKPEELVDAFPTWAEKRTRQNPRQSNITIVEHPPAHTGGTQRITLSTNAGVGLLPFLNVMGATFIQIQTFGCRILVRSNIKAIGELQPDNTYEVRNRTPQLPILLEMLEPNPGFGNIRIYTDGTAVTLASTGL